MYAYRRKKSSFRWHNSLEPLHCSFTKDLNYELLEARLLTKTWVNQMGRFVLNLAGFDTLLCQHVVVKDFKTR